MTCYYTIRFKTPDFALRNELALRLIQSGIEQPEGTRKGLRKSALRF